MPPTSQSQDPRIDVALDAALVLLKEQGEGAVIPGHVAEIAGIPRWWIHRASWRDGTDLLRALANREIFRIAEDLGRTNGPTEAAQTLARNLSVILLAEHLHLLWENGPIPSALMAAIDPAPWWIAAAWIAICAEGARRGMAAWQVFQILTDKEERNSGINWAPN